MPTLQITQQGRGMSSVPAVAPGQAGRHGHPRGHHIVARAKPSPRLLTVFSAWECKIFADPMNVSQGCNGQRIQGCECTEELLVVLGEPSPSSQQPSSSFGRFPAVGAFPCFSSKGTRQTPPLRASSWLLLCSSWSELREGWGASGPCDAREAQLQESAAQPSQQHQLPGAL